jgi:hypothetical protein
VSARHAPPSLSPPPPRPPPARPSPPPRRKILTTDWLWSVGAHPLSWTSTGTAYSQLHIDALHRWAPPGEAVAKVCSRHPKRHPA